MPIINPNIQQLNSNIPDDLIFSGVDYPAAIAARDVFFVANPARKIDRLYVILEETNTHSIKYQQYILVSDTWVDMTSVVKGETGRTGDQGVQGPQGPVSLLWKENFDLLVNYVENDGVFYNGSSYRCIAPTTGNAPTETIYWALIAQKGNIGDEGPVGPIGPVGPMPINWKGLYSGLSAYAINDGVQYQNSSYRAIVANTDVLPIDPTTWELLAKKGNDGTDGEAGLNFLGEYSEFESYVPRDAVTFEGSCYICKLATTGHEPTQAVWWDLFTAKGQDGILFDFLGGYDPEYQYQLYNLCTYQGSTYGCNNEFGSLGHAPPDVDYWYVIASKGDTGVSGINVKGIYSNSTAYVPNDLVTYLGNSYVCTAGNTGSLPTDINYWALFVAQGAQGDIGPAGPVGMTWKNTWSNILPYNKDDVVYYNKSSYIALKDSINVQPATDETSWALVAAKGELSALEDRFALDATTEYTIGNVISYQGIRYCCRIDHTTDTVPTFIPSNWVPMSVGMVGATATESGTKGLVPIPESTFQDAKLVGSGEWDKTGRKTLVTLENFVANATMDPLTTVDVCEVIAIPQATSGITISIPNPTENTKVRKLIFINTGSTSFSLSTGHTVYAGKWIELYWALALQTWETYVGDTKIYDQANAYQAYDRCILGNITVYANAAIPANTVFAWGTSGATWAPVLPVGYIWKGPYTASTNYITGDIFTQSSVISASFFRVSSPFTSTTSFGTDVTTNGGVAVEKVSAYGWGLSSSSSLAVGATATANGRFGSPRRASIGEQDATLKGDNTWDRTGRGAYKALSNYTVDTTLPAVDTTSISEYLSIPQTTAGINITLPTPQIVNVTRRISIANTGTVDFTVNTVKVKVDQVATFIWVTNGSKWYQQAGGASLTTNDLAYGNAKAQPTNDTYTTSYALAATTATTVTCGATASGVTSIGWTTGQLKFTVLQAGKYKISAGSTITASAVNWGRTIITVSGVVKSQSPNEWVSTANAGVSSETETILDLAVNDVVECKAYSQNSGYMQGGYLTIEQLPVATLVDPELLSPETLSYLKMDSGLTGQTITNTTTNITFSNPLIDIGTNILYSNGIISFKGGARYKLTFAHSFIQPPSGGYFYYKFWDVTNSQFIGNAGGGDTVNSASTTIPASMISLDLDLTSLPVASTRQISVRSSATNGSTIVGNSSHGSPWFCAEQMPTSFVVSVDPESVLGSAIEYGYYRWSASQSITLSVQDINPDSTISGTIPNSNGVFSLTGGKTYEIEMGLYATWTGAGVTSISLVDAGTNTQISGSPTFSLNAVSGGNNSGDPAWKFIYTPATNQTVKFRTNDSTLSCTIFATRSWVSIRQLPTATIIDKTVTATNDQANAGYFDIGNMRYQWGESLVNSANPVVVTLPAPFKNASYAVNSTMLTGNDTAVALTAATRDRTTTTFLVKKTYNTSGTFGFASEGFTWIAIGLKP
ncbi:hypothetical protein KLEP7_gp195 [Pseudaeromonas phage vB_PpeM_ KLEP7]|nr:hypothetical protein KLEP7_gp195 [Pseudaeromonas phage vB_PpeM_ KLEP7]